MEASPLRIVDGEAVKERILGGSITLGGGAIGELGVLGEDAVVHSLVYGKSWHKIACPGLDMHTLIMIP
jgi:hypothetical protein